jgi:protein-L-isoaspartate(D-aspartate) O-methyltransferase
MTSEEHLRIVRRAYARQITSVMGVSNQRIEDAYAEVPREHFLGEGPWPIARWMRGYVNTPNGDPVYLYTDDVIGLLPERQINNGQPSLHAHLIASAALAEGDHVVHIGVGGGYYSAIMAHVLGPLGRMTAIEFEPDLAARARANLSTYPTVSIIEGDGASVPFDDADVIYVNAGATRPADIWLDRLKDKGRLILPLTTDNGFISKDPSNFRRSGGVLRVERSGDEFLARWISPVAIYPCQGMRDETSERALAEALAKDGREKVTRLYRRDDLPEEQCFLRAPGWSLAYE